MDEEEMTAFSFMQETEECEADAADEVFDAHLTAADCSNVKKNA